MRILCNGGVAVVELLDGSAPTLLGAGDIPTIGTKARQRVDVHELHAWILRHRSLQHALIERAQAMPRQGASSGFHYGRAVGSIEAVIAILQIPISIIEPRRWKKVYRLHSKDKEGSRQRALQLFPAAHELLVLKRYHNRAEAILIAAAFRSLVSA